ncbi:ArnT family glycosyltransferase [Virgibacillus dokdonensis]|uniref:ArnT family glycosyltransferase n=1 Tax=Virgibacillus dokdonensis TaxID=302167 RepID=UPI00098BA76B|nr:glycosyltransferase family 39 protein [Virgibacillus dokdonensis]
MEHMTMSQKLSNHLPIYLLGIILIFSLILHIIFFVEHPGTNFIQPTDQEIQEQLNNGKISERVAMLREHTWKYGSRDAYLYSEMANQIINDGIYGYNTDKQSNAFVTPGHPLILVVVFQIANVVNMDQMTMVKIFNMLLSIATIALIYLIGTKAFKNKWVGLVAALFYATYFTPLHYFRTALTEIPGIFFFCLSIYLFLLAMEKNKKFIHFLFAVVFCYGVLIRPVIAPLVLIGFIIMFIKHRKRLKTWVLISSIWAAGAAVIIAPWVIRNFLLFDEFILLSTHSGNSWFAGSNPFNIYDFSDYFKEQKELGMDSKEYAIMKIKDGFENNFGLWLSWFTVGKTYELFKLPDAIYYYHSYSFAGTVKTMHNYLVSIAIVTTIISLFSRKREAVAVAAVLIMYIGLSNLFLTIPRYGFFIIPIMCVLNGYAVIAVTTKVVEIVKKEQRRKRPVSNVASGTKIN